MLLHRVIGVSFSGKKNPNPNFSLQASQKEIAWVIRGMIVVFGILSATIAIQVNSILTLYLLCTDLMYVLTLPEVSVDDYVFGFTLYAFRCVKLEK